MTPDIIRAPNHVGDLVMSLPALQAAPDADVVVPRALAPLLSLIPRSGAIIPFDRGTRGLYDAARHIRTAARSRNHTYRSGVLLTPSFSSAALFRLGGVRRIRGIATDGRRALLSDPLDANMMRGRSRPASYFEIMTGAALVEPPAPHIPISNELKDSWWQHAGLQAQPLIGIFPGGNAPSRRWDVARFAETVALLAAAYADTHRVIVFGGPAETAATRTVAGEQAIDMGGRTTLPMLAAALSTCDLLITNDSGPCHIAAAVGTRTLSLWGAGDPNETSVRGAAHTLLRHPELPCVPCVRNECPRRGTGYVLPEARLECLRLIAVPDVVSAAQTMLAR